jgi:mRNA interferase RelE/StbE
MKYTGGERKIRVGDYRIVYEIGTQELIVLILKIGDRKDVYE